MKAGRRIKSNRECGEENKTLGRIITPVFFPNWEEKLLILYII